MWHKVQTFIEISAGGTYEKKNKEDVMMPFCVLFLKSKRDCAVPNAQELLQNLKLLKLRVKCLQHVEASLD